MALAASVNLFAMLGIQAALGRTFSAEEGYTGRAEQVAMLSYDFWQSRFHGDPNVIGTQLDQASGAKTNGARRPAGRLQIHLSEGALRSGYLWALDRAVESGDIRRSLVTARLKPGVTPAQAGPVCARCWRTWRESTHKPTETGGGSAYVGAGLDHQAGPVDSDYLAWRRDLRTADRVRKRGQPSFGEAGGPRARNYSAGRSGRQPLATGAGVSGREPPDRAGCRRPRLAALELGDGSTAQFVAARGCHAATRCAWMAAWRGSPGRFRWPPPWPSGCCPR